MAEIKKGIGPHPSKPSAGSLIAFNLYHQDLKPGDHGVICSFGAGYSIGSLLVRKR